jgi:hypothetical protein
MPTFKPTTFDPDLHLPIGGKTYTIKAPNGDEGQRLRRVAVDGNIPIVYLIDEAILVLGSTFDEMAADGVAWSHILHAGRTAIIHYGMSPDLAEIHWGMSHLGKLTDLDAILTRLDKAATT